MEKNLKMAAGTAVVAPNRPQVPNRPVAPPVQGKANIPATPARPQAPVAPAATAPVAAPSAAPVAETATAPVAGTAKRGRKKGSGKGGRAKSTLVTYPGLFVYNDDGSPVMIETDKKDEAGNAIVKHQTGQLQEIPTDYDPAKHAKLTAKDFVDEAMFLDFRAGVMEQSAARMRARAENLRKLGSVEDRGRANKLLKMREQMAKLQEQLQSQGIDVAALLAGGAE